MQKKTFKLTYPSLERLLQDYSQLKIGTLFLPTRHPLQIGTELTLKIGAPEINRTFQLDCTVTRLSGTLPDNPLKEHKGMQLSIKGDTEAFIKELNLALSHAEKRIEGSGAIHYQKPTGERKVKESEKKGTTRKYSEKKTNKHPLGTKQKSNNDRASKLSTSWIKKALQREKETIEEEPVEEKIKFSSTAEKKDLTPEERQKVAPVGEFVMDLTKAMLRSGYYSPDHPGSTQAKQGLFNRFQSILGDANEILIANRETREKNDFYIMGILDEPISIKLLVGTSRAELFEPKLREYFNRKSLMSFAIKKKISLDHFNRFIDIMCDPHTDNMEKHKVGELLTGQLVENGITDISTNFIEDKLFFKQKLPWRVEMAIQRLAKDLKVLPQYSEASAEKLKTMKIDIIKDILRPLKHPDLLKELIINCYVIVENTKHLDLEEIEQTLVNAFPIPFLHATSLSIFQDIEKYKGELQEHLSDAEVAKRYNSMKRILKLVASRMILEKTPRVHNFLEKLYFSKLLTYEELPSAVKYQIDTSLMVEDLKSNTEYYIESIIKSQSPDSGVFLIKWFHRIAPKLIEVKNWTLLLYLLSATDRANTEVTIFPRPQGSFLNPFVTIFHEFTDDLATAFNNPDKNKRQRINDIILKLGSIGIDVYGKVLSESESQEIRKTVLASLGEMGDSALQWARQNLDSKDQAWYIHRNALLILNKAGGNKKDDTQRVEKFLKNSNPRVREEALKTLIALHPNASIHSIIDAVNDTNEKVRMRALHALSHLTALSEESFTKLTRIISSEPPENKEDAHIYSQKVSYVIGILSAHVSQENKQMFENLLLELLGKLSKPQKWFSKILKSAVDEDNVIILKAATKALKEVGGDVSIASLNEMAKGKSPYAGIIKDTLASKEKRKDAATAK